ncbi:hypothetical protein ACLX1H_009014 [Fusarium chlamydosporum]
MVHNWRFDWEGPVSFAREVLCHPLHWARRIQAFIVSDDGPEFGLLNCTQTEICFSDGNCGDAGVDLTMENKRLHAKLFGRHSNHFSYPGYKHHHHHHRLSRRLLERRAAHKIRIEALPDNDDSDSGSDGPSKVKCTMTTLSRFLQFSSGVASTYGPIPLAFWDKISDIDLSQEPNAPRVPGSGPQFARIFERAYECLGSTDNDEVFMLVQYQVKDVKNFVDHRSLEGKSRQNIQRDRRVVFGRRRAALSSIAYINTPETHTRLNKIHPDDKVKLGNYWLEWIKDYFEHLSSKLKSNMLEIMNQAINLVEDEGDDLGDESRDI